MRPDGDRWNIYQPSVADQPYRIAHINADGIGYSTREGALEARDEALRSLAVEGELIADSDQLKAVMRLVEIDIDEALRRLKLTPSPVWPATAPCPCGCVQDVATQSDDCGCCFVTGCEGDDRYPLILCRLHDGHEGDPPVDHAPFYRNKHRCWQCATKGSPSEGWECPGCGQREWCEVNCTECKGKKG